MNLFPKPPSILQTINELDNWPNFVRDEFEQRAINVKWFGAKGDGVTDDTAAIQDAINQAYNKGGGIVFFDKGTYIVTKISLKPNVILLSKSFTWSTKRVTILKLKPNTNIGNQGLITIEQGGQGFGVINIQLDGNKNNNSYGHGIYQVGTDTNHQMSFSVFQNFVIQNFTGNGIEIQNAWGCLFEEFVITQNNGMGIYLNSKVDIQANVFTRGDITRNSQGNIVLEGYGSQKVERNIFQNLNCENALQIYIKNDKVYENIFSNITFYTAKNLATPPDALIKVNGNQNLFQGLCFDGGGYSVIIDQQSGYVNIYTNIIVNDLDNMNPDIIHLNGNANIIDGVIIAGVNYGGRVCVIGNIIGSYRNLISNITSVLTGTMTSPSIIEIISGSLNVIQNVSISGLANAPIVVNANCWDTKISNTQHIINDNGHRTLCNGIGKNGNTDPAIEGDWYNQGKEGISVIWNSGATNYMSVFRNGTWIRFTST